MKEDIELSGYNNALDCFSGYVNATDLKIINLIISYFIDGTYNNNTYISDYIV